MKIHWEEEKKIVSYWKRNRQGNQFFTKFSIHNNFFSSGHSFIKGHERMKSFVMLGCAGNSFLQEKRFFGIKLSFFEFRIGVVVKISVKSRSSLFIEFALYLLSLCVKSGKFDSEKDEDIAKLDPFINIIQQCLLFKYDKVYLLNYKIFL